MGNSRQFTIYKIYKLFGSSFAENVQKYESAQKVWYYEIFLRNFAAALENTALSAPPLRRVKANARATLLILRVLRIT